MQEHQEGQVAAMGECRRLSELYTTKVEDEMKKSKTQLAVQNVGKQDPKRHLNLAVDQMLLSNILQSLGTAINTKAF